MSDAGMPRPAAYSFDASASYDCYLTNEIKKDKAHLANCRSLPIV
jgi:hypothetical protein